MPRLDVYLAEEGLATSRSEAKGLICSGAVTVNGRVVTKPSCDVLEGAVISVDRSSVKYVSRGGLKLEEAFCRFDIGVEGRYCLDVGASSGGFTDCLLQHGAERVVAVDSGCGQLASSLRCDPRVVSVENYNARYMKAKDLPFVPSFAVMDVSFISVTLIIPALLEVLEDGADLICLIKPQFEVGRSGVGKGGIVKSEALRLGAVRKVVDAATAVGFCHMGTVVSPIKGGDGNVEYLAHFRKKLPKEAR